MITVPVDKQVQFFNWQIEEIEKKRLRYLKSLVLDLEKNDRLYIGKIWGYDTSRGTLILRFRKGSLPRLKVPMTLCYVKSSAGPTSGWDFTYEEFRRHHTEISTVSLPIFYLKNEPNEDWRYIGVQGIEPDFMSHIFPDLEHKKHPLVVLGEEDPPIQYLINLRNFTRENPTDDFLNLRVDVEESMWHPSLMGRPETVLQEALSAFENRELSIVQGPPGTGKTHLIAGICSYFLKQNKKVCVTALANKALIEVAKESALREFVKAGKVQKTNLSGDEEKAVNGLQLCEDPSMPIGGNLILASYYKFSFLLKEINRLGKIYDILIIEEASQSFLATIAGFRRFGKKVILVGDPKQLAPIVESEAKASLIHPAIKGVIEGLKTVSFNFSSLSHRMRYTYRLTSAAADQTGVFYDNTLVSVSPLENRHAFTTSYSYLFCPKGGASLLKLNIGHEGKKPKDAIEMITEITEDLLKHNPTFKVALLTPFKLTNYAMYDSLMDKGVDIKDIEIETVDRIQGLTSDITIVLIPFEGVAFAFKESRFNVATSRARRGTLIITDESVDMLQSPSAAVKRFISRCAIVKNVKL